MNGFALSLGVLLLLASTCAIGDAARRLASRFWPGELLVQMTGGLLLGTSMVVVGLTLLGVAGLLTAAAMLALSAAAWLGVAMVSRHPSELARAPVHPAHTGHPRRPTVLEAASFAPSLLLLLLLGGSILFALQQPRPVFDALAGHLPVAVQWLQAGNIRFMPYITPQSIPAQYPANQELIDLWLMLPVHRDFLVQLAGLPGLGMAIAGVIMAIRELGGRWLSAIAWALLVPTLPRVFSELIGTNMDDLLLIGSVALTTAFLARHRRLGDDLSVLMAAMAIGLGIGTRYAALVVVPPLVVLLALQVLRLRPSLTRVVALGAGAGILVIITGGYWYLRNWLITGDPVYPQDLPWHSVQATAKAVFPWVRSYAALGVAPHDWLEAVNFMFHGYGPIALLLVMATLLFPVLTVIRGERDRLARAWSLLPAVGVVCFLVTPGSAGYLVNGRLVPIIQSLSLRYILPFLIYSAVMLGLESSQLRPAAERLVVASISTVAVAAVVYLGLFKPDYAGSFISAKPLAAATVITATTAVIALRLVRVRRRVPFRLAAAATSVLVFAAVAPLLASRYDGHRMSAGMPYEDLRLKLAGHSSVAIAGFCQIYGLYDPDLNRRVEYLTGADDQYNRPLATEYNAWLASLRSHNATAVVLATDQCLVVTPIPQRHWVHEHPDVFRPVFASSDGEVYEILHLASPGSS